MAKNKCSSKDVGLAIGLLFGRYLFKAEDLHYGLWPEGLAVEPANIPIAQAKHSEFIISNIPQGVKTILDVGCGAGQLASKLIARGFEVDCVSPSPVLTEATRAKVGQRSAIYETKYETLNTDKKYDLVIFSESFQYIPVNEALRQSIRFLKPSGHVLICDFFATDAPGESPLYGGHNLAKFRETSKAHPLEMLKDIDITRETAPNLDLVNGMMQNLLKPVWDIIINFLKERHPVLSKFAFWKYRKKMDRMNDKYFSGRRNGENFSRYKSYRLFLFKRS
ncbi:MAG: class I SAM-dependent methyltransferase [Endomicrobiales bacterium]|nr:class I SAM-dependent methyltransferase [Endomicrobiales bacterium]